MQANASESKRRLKLASEPKRIQANQAKDKAKVRVKDKVKDKAKVKAKDLYISLLLTHDCARWGGCVQLPLHHGEGALSFVDGQEGRLALLGWR